LPVAASTRTLAAGPKFSVEVAEERQQKLEPVAQQSCSPIYGTNFIAAAGRGGSLERPRLRKPIPIEVLFSEVDIDVTHEDYLWFFQL
jgi:hypothetical protein